MFEPIAMETSVWELITMETSVWELIQVPHQTLRWLKKWLKVNRVEGGLGLLRHLYE